MIVQRIKAKNDTNGNPRRVWVAYDPATGAIVSTHDEGYAGFPRELGRIGDHVQIADVEVSPAEYRAFVKEGR